MMDQANLISDIRVSMGSLVNKAVTDYTFTVEPAPVVLIENDTFRIKFPTQITLKEYLNCLSEGELASDLSCTVDQSLN